MFVLFLCFIFLFLSPPEIAGDEISSAGFSSFVSRSWSAPAELPHNSVTSFYRDENGLLWVGTVEGLARIGSKSSKIFATNTNAAILSNKINALTGCGGKVFVASAKGISEIGNSGGTVSGIFDSRGISALAAVSGCVLYASDGKEIFEIKSGKINKLTNLNDLSGSSVTALFSDGGNLYAGFESGAVHSYSDGVFSENLCPANSAPVTSGKAADGRVLAGTAKGEILEIGNGKCLKTAESGRREAVTSLDFSGRTVVFTSGGELFFAENGAVKACGAFCAGSGSVSGVMLDNGLVWLSGSRGMTLFYPGKFITLGRESGLLNEKVYALVEDGKGRVWAGTRGGGLFVHENGKFRYVKDRKGDIGRFVGGMLHDEDGNILVGTTDGIVSFSPEKPSVFRRMKMEKGTSASAVSVIFRDRKSRLWAGGGGGAIYIETKKGWHLLRKFGDDSDFVSAIAEDAAGNLWFASSKGLWQLNENNEFHEINQELALDVPVSLLVTDGGSVLVGTMNRGIYVITRDMKISRIDSRKGLCSDTVLGITGDDLGNLWFSSTKGIFAIPEERLLEAASAENGSVECLLFGSDDGIRRPESTGGVQPSVLKRKNGDLWFPTLEGIAVLEKNGRKTAGFYAEVPESEPVIIDENEKKSSYSFIWLVLAALGVTAFFVLKKTKKENLTPESISVARGENLTPEPQTSPPAPLQSGEGRDAVSGEENDEIFDPETDAVDVKPKYEGYQLDDEVAAAYAEEAKALMEKEKLYRNPDLTLPVLAKKLKLTPNTLSQVLNGYCGQSFYNFVNGYRLEEVVSMMRDPEFDDKSVLELLYEAGFKSKSTFNPIFKKWTGKTPSEYRKEIQEKR